jgi:hypothetical protein
MVYLVKLKIRAHLPTADRAFRSNLFAYRKKYFRFNRLRGLKSAILGGF